MRAWLGVWLIGFAVSASAHKSSDAYLQIDAGADRLELRVDLALRDLDVVLDLDGDGDGRLTWGEVRAAWPRIEALATGRIGIGGCELKAAGRGLERRSDGTYAVLRYTAACRLADPAPIRYTMFGDVDPTHRGLAKLTRGGGRPQLIVLDPNAAARSTAMALSSSASSSVASGGTSTANPGAATAPSRWQFLSEGVHHIVTGYDHVLFLICLLLPAVLLRQQARWQPVSRVGAAIWPVAGIVTAFTVAHSITLGLAALQIVSLPARLVEPAIAVTIALAAVDNLRPVFPVPRIVVAFVFGLIHGFGFAGVLAELDLPRVDFAWALLQFNAGIEAGQLAIVLCVVTVLFAVRRARFYVPVVLRGGSIAALAIAVIWFTERLADVKILPA